MPVSDLQYLSGCPSDEVRRNPAVRADVLRVARLDPRLACAILSGMAQFQPQFYTMSFKFASGAADQLTGGSFDAPVSADFWCDDVNYQYRNRPAAFAGNILESFAENQTAKNPHIDISLQVSGAYSMPWLFSNAFRPVESLCRNVHDAAPTACCRDFLLIFPQAVKGSAIPRIVLADPASELIITFAGSALGFQKFNGISIEEARRMLAGEYQISQRAYDVAGGLADGAHRGRKGKRRTSPRRQRRDPWGTEPHGAPVGPARLGARAHDGRVVDRGVR